MRRRVEQRIIETLLKSRHVLITAHSGPDGDSLGAQLGLAGLLTAQGIGHMIVNEGVVPHKYAFLPGIESVRNIRDVVTAPRRFDTAVVIECSSLDRIGSVSRLIDEQCTVINIDHHPDSTPFGGINMADTTAAAAGEMIHDLLVYGKFTIDAAMATNLYTAILTDTGRFHYNSTTPRSLRTAARLIELGADPEAITEQVYFNLRPQTVRLTGMALSGMQYLFDGRLCLITVDRRMLQEAEADQGDTEGLANYSLYAKGVLVGVLLTEMDADATKVSFRSHNGVNVAEAATRFGGGGHINASGCVIGLPLAQARAQVVEYLRGKLNGSV